MYLGLIFSKWLSYKSYISLKIVQHKTHPRVRFKVVFDGPLGFPPLLVSNCIVTLESQMK